MLNSPIAAASVLGTPPAAHPAAASAGAGHANEPGAFARELGRAAQDNEADEAAPAPAPANGNTTREARAKPRAENDRGKTERSPAQRKVDAAEAEAAPADKPRPARPGDAEDAEGTPDLHALLASQMNHAAPAPAPGAGGSAPAGEQAVAKAEAGRGKAAAATDRPAAAAAAAAEAAPAFVLPAAAPTPAAQHAEPAAAAAATPAPYAAQIQAPVGSPDFAPGLSAQVSVMVRDGIQEARLQLNPAEMGPITVQIQVEGNSAQVTMTAEQAPTRDALEQAMPSLAGALREEGLTLTGGGVFEQARQPRDDAPAAGAGSRGGHAGGAGGAADGDGNATAAPPRRVATRGAVDVYA